MMLRLLTAVLLLLAWTVFPARSQESPPQAVFHHVHLNSIDPASAIGFYTRTFDVTKRVSLAGFDAIQSENMYLLFNRVAKPPRTSPDSAIWHFGWGSTDMEADYQKLLAGGVAFHTPITRLPSGILFAYMKGPDGALVEINTSRTRAFIHVHLYSEAPLCAAEWYQKHLGGVVRSNSQRSGPCEVPFAAPSEPLGVIRSPSAVVRFGDISLIIYPRQRPGPLVSPRGHVADHIAFACPDLDAALERLRASGVKVIEGPRRFGNSRARSAMIEGPDAIAIELVEKS
ncbi:MAG TPA: VOC family protein [Blastocatellia bacterium]|nr:VOC family protein [Blastocatellia bacterium]